MLNTQETGEPANRVAGPRLSRQILHVSITAACQCGLRFRLVPVRGYAKEGDTENVEFVGIAV